MNKRPPHVNCANWVPSMVTLVDGTVVANDSEAWRFQCEAQHILNLPNKQARQVLLSAIEGRRGGGGAAGTAVRRALEFKIMELWKAKQPPTAAA